MRASVNTYVPVSEMVKSKDKTIALKILIEVRDKFVVHDVFDRNDWLQLLHFKTLQQSSLQTTKVLYP